MSGSGRRKSRLLRELMSGSLVALLAAATLPGAQAAAQTTPTACAVASSSAATPEAEAIELEAATPSTLPLASPAATPVATRDALADDITHTAEQLAACLSDNNAAAVVQLASERYLGQLFGSSVPLSVDDFISISQSISATPVRIVSVLRFAPDHDVSGNMRSSTPRALVSGLTNPLRDFAARDNDVVDKAASDYEHAR